MMYTRYMVEGSVESSKGFYVGDVCYALSEEVYHGFWGDKQGFKDGVFTVPGTDGLKFAVGGTAYGDGSYADQLGHCFPVDAGVIGLVPIELVDDMEKAIDLGLVVDAPGKAEFTSEDGIFSISLPDGQVVEIDTHHEDYEDADD